MNYMMGYVQSLYWHFHMSCYQQISTTNQTTAFTKLNTPLINILQCSMCLKTHIGSTTNIWKQNQRRKRKKQKKGGEKWNSLRCKGGSTIIISETNMSFLRIPSTPKCDHSCFMIHQLFIIFSWFKYCIF